MVTVHIPQMDEEGEGSLYIYPRWMRRVRVVTIHIPQMDEEVEGGFCTYTPDG